jgi:hypothetical protein
MGIYYINRLLVQGIEAVPVRHPPPATPTRPISAAESA